jgi:multiple antibiotic resistance protein
MPHAVAAGLAAEAVRSPMETDILPWTEYSGFTISLFAVLTPFGALPVFLSLTAGLPSTKCSRVAAVAAVTAALVLVGAALLGWFVLAALGTSVGSLRVGGGLVLLLMAFSMLNPYSMLNPHAAPSSRTAELDRNTLGQDSSGGIVPLGLPLLAGPGAISTVIMEMGHGAGFRHDALVIACILSTCGAAWALMRFAQPVGRHLGPSGLTVMRLLFGLLLAANAIEIITDGMRALFPVLG